MNHAEINASPVRKAAPDAVRVERLMPGPVERLWSFLVDEEKRSQWFAGGPLEPRVGGKGRLHFFHKNITDEPAPERYAKMDDGGFFSDVEVTAYDPPRRLAYTWPNGEHVSEVIFELTPEGRDVRLVLTHRRLKDADEMAEVAGGWHAHLDALLDLVEGRKPNGFWANVTKLDAIYREAFVGS